MENRIGEIIASSKSPPQIKQGAIELRMGCEAFVTGTTDRKILPEKTGEVVIPPGQFALLLTEERVTIPREAIGFISIKFGLKVRGLVNVSGFHVDPGFNGWITYSVYNAGPRHVTLSRGQCAFPLWLAYLDQPTPEPEAYSRTNNHGRGQLEKLDDGDIMNLQGEIASPGALKAKLEELQKEFTTVVSNQKVVITIAGSLLVAMFSICGALVGGLVLGYFNRSVQPAAAAQGNSTPSSPSIVDTATVTVPAQSGGGFPAPPATSTTPDIGVPRPSASSATTPVSPSPTLPPASNTPPPAPSTPVKPSP